MVDSLSELMGTLTFIGWEIIFLRLNFFLNLVGACYLETNWLVVDLFRVKMD